MVVSYVVIAVLIAWVFYKSEINYWNKGMRLHGSKLDLILSCIVIAIIWPIIVIGVIIMYFNMKLE